MPTNVTQSSSDTFFVLQYAPREHLDAILSHLVEEHKVRLDAEYNLFLPEPQRAITLVPGQGPAWQ